MASVVRPSIRSLLRYDGWYRSAGRSSSQASRLYPYTGPPLGTESRITWSGTVLGRIDPDVFAHRSRWPRPDGSLKRIASLAGPACTRVPLLSALSIMGLSISCTKSACKLASER